ncbi:MAG: hypothetical protein IPN79_01565 [Saprospiraceae bacterium]|nr:hypothetical protein [Saprospiraceae bacterium]
MNLKKITPLTLLFFIFISIANAQITELYLLNDANVEILVSPSPSFGVYPRVFGTSGKPLYTNSFANNDQLPDLANNVYFDAGDSLNTYFGGDNPDIASFGHASSPVFLNKRISKNNFPLKLEGYFFNRSSQASYNESYFWIGNFSHEFYNPTNTTLPNANFQEGLIMGGRPDLQLINNSKSATEPSTRLFDKNNENQLYNRWYKISVIIDITESDKLVINKFFVDNIQILSEPILVQDMSYFNLNDLMVAMCIDDFGKDFSITYNYKIENNISVEACKQYVWDNDTLFQSGIYTKTYVTSFGCDSVVNLTLTILPQIEKNLDYFVCKGDSIQINDVFYSTEGFYQQTLVSSEGCDSILNITISVSDILESLLKIKLCNDEFIEINNVLYSESGNYIQTLKTETGCDSILNIQITKGLSTRSESVYSLCNAGSYVINGSTYNAAGTYEQNQTNSSGCDSIVVIKILPCVQNVTYDFQQCNALTPENSMNYDEFLPVYRIPLACGSLSMSNVYRDTPQENKHSCTNGQASTLAMCISVSTSCQFDQTDQTPVSFGFKAKPADGSMIRFNHLEFYHLSPLQYNWIQGASGPNNYPTRFGIEIYKNDVLVYVQSNINTSNQWTKGKFDLFENEDFFLLEDDSVRIELTPYCVTNVGGDVSVWDVDNISLFFSCEDQENRVIGGQILSNTYSTSVNKEIRRYEGYKVNIISTQNNNYSFSQNDPLKTYSFSALSNEDISNGVSTLDLVLVQNHILGLSILTDPVKLIAADANKDGKINSLDLVSIRKVILGVTETFPNNYSWRFIPEQHLESIINPLFIQDSFQVIPGYKNISDLNFYPVKIGDINGQSLEKIKNQDTYFED